MFLGKSLKNNKKMVGHRREYWEMRALIALGSKVWLFTKTFMDLPDRRDLIIAKALPVMS